MTAPIRVAKRNDWTGSDPKLLHGELGQESDTAALKIGDGLRNWNKLPYFGCPGYWASFWDLTSQTAVANTPTAILLRNADLDNSGISIASNTTITFAYAGVYSITFSIQFTNSDNSIHDTNVWLRRNGTNVVASNSRFSITSKRGSVHGNVIGTVNFVLKLAAADYLELIWATSDAAAYIHAEAAQTSPFAHPSIPGIICTIIQVASA